jgi:hypothetical protein
MIPHGSSQRRAATALPHRDYSCGQYCHHRRAAGRRPRLPSPAPSLLRQRGPVRIQGTLPASTEASVRSAHHLAEATTLLPGVLDFRCHRLPARRHPAEPRCYWKNLQVGSQTRRPQHRLQATHNHQVAGTSRLHVGVAGESATYSNRATRALGDVLRRLTQPRGCKCRGTLEFSNGRTTQVRPADLLEGQTTKPSTKLCYTSSASRLH